MHGPCQRRGLLFMISESIVCKDVTELIADCIPDEEWERVCQVIVQQIVDNMPSNVLMELTGSHDAFDKAEQVLNSFYLVSSKHELIKDSFNLLGAEETAFILDALNLTSPDGVSENDPS